MVTHGGSVSKGPHHGLLQLPLHVKRSVWSLSPSGSEYLYVMCNLFLRCRNFYCDLLFCDHFEPVKGFDAADSVSRPSEGFPADSSAPLYFVIFIASLCLVMGRGVGLRVWPNHFWRGTFFQMESVTVCSLPPTPRRSPHLLSQCHC